MQDGIYIGYSSGNKIYCNNFVSNPNNINNPQGNIFDSPQRLAYTYDGQDHVGYMGNYYSDYRGTDREGNGIGDTVYPIGDRYPLVKLCCAGTSPLEASRRPHRRRRQIARVLITTVRKATSTPTVQRKFQDLKSDMQYSGRRWQLSLC